MKLHSPPGTVTATLYTIATSGQLSVISKERNRKAQSTRKVDYGLGGTVCYNH